LREKTSSSQRTTRFHLMENLLRSNMGNTLPKITEGHLLGMAALHLGWIYHILTDLNKGKEILGVHLFRVNGDLVCLMKEMYLDSNIGDHLLDSKDNNMAKEDHLLDNKDNNMAKEDHLLDNKDSNMAKEDHLLDNKDSNMTKEDHLLGSKDNNMVKKDNNSKKEPHQERSNRIATRLNILDGLMASNQEKALNFKHVI